MPVPTSHARYFVPNVPCGVERFIILKAEPLVVAFLMYRVELKAAKVLMISFSFSKFLMYRVELKALQAFLH